MPADIESDDAISITSTAPSEAQEEYPVEQILAQKLQNGATVYLVKWEGYPIERATWEPKESFGDDSTIQEWMNRKGRIAKGEEPLFDVEAWEASQKAISDAKTKRKKRRKALRKKHGIPTSSDEEESSDEEREKVPARTTRRRKRRSTESDDEVVMSLEEVSSRGKKVVKTKKRKPSNTPSEEEEEEEEEEGIPSDDSLLEDIREKEAKRAPKKRRLQKASALRAASKSETPELKTTRSGLPEPSTRRSLPSSTNVSRPPSRRASEVSATSGPAAAGFAGKPRAPTSKTAGRKPMTKRQLPPEPVEAPKKPVNIFANVFEPPKARNITKPDYTKPHDSHRNITKDALFANKSTERRFEKAGRNEPAPDITKLKLLDPRAMQRRPTFRTPAEMSPTEERASTGQGPFVEGEVASPEPMATGPANAGSASKPTGADTAAATAAEAPTIANLPVAAVEQSQGISDKKKIKLAEYVLSITNKVDNEAKDKDPTEKEKANIAKTPVDEVLDLTMSSGTLTFEGVADEDAYRLTSRKAVDVVDIEIAVELGPSQVKMGNLKLLGIKRDLRQRSTELFEGLWFNKMFTAADFKKLWDTCQSKILSQGDVGVVDKSTIEGLTDYFRVYGSAGVHMKGHFALVVYPANTEPWQFLKTGSGTKTSDLKWMIFDLEDFELVLPGNSKISSQEAKKSGSNLVGWHFVRLTYATRTVYNYLFDMKFETFLPPSPTSKKSPKVIVFVIADNGLAFNDFLLLGHWLKCFSINVYWSGIKGSWEHFTNVAERGIVLIHSNFCRFGLDGVPKLASIINNYDKAINTFEFGRRHILSPDGKSVQVSQGFQCTRLFLFGGAVLLTDEMFVKHPSSVLAIFKWFRWQLARAQSGAWKLVVRGGDVTNWVNHIFTTKVEENTETTEIQKLRASVWMQLREFMYKPPGNILNDPNLVDVLQVGSDSGYEPPDPLQQVVLLSLLAHEDYTKFRRFVAISQTPIEGAEKYGVVLVQTSEEFIRDRTRK